MNRNSEPINVHRCFIFLLPILFCVLVSSSVWVEKSSGKQVRSIPTLRLNTGSHTAALWAIDIDADERFAVTCSNDKTVRIWDIASYSLIKTLRPPIADGDEGRLLAVAISPDGHTIACGGSTGRFWEDGHCVYLFDRETGEITGRLTGIFGSIHHLDYSKDGRFLAVGFWKGLRVYRVPTYELVGQDLNYKDKCSCADFDCNGRLVTATVDGFLRLYTVGAEKIELVETRKAFSESHLFSICFSPDGDKIAAGYLLYSAQIKNRRSKVDVFSGKNLTYLYSPDTRGIKRGLESVAWSSDGRFLYAGGYPRAIRGKRFAPIVKWGDAGLGNRTVLRAGKSPIQDIVALKNGSILFAAYKGSWGAFNRRDERFFYHRASNPDFRGWVFGDKVFLISGDAAKVAFSFRAEGKFLALFDVEDRSLKIDPTLDAGLLAPIFHSPGINITDWLFSRAPMLNGNRLELRNKETSLCLAIAPDGNSFILGTEWHLYRFDTEGKQIWSIPVRSIALSANVSKDSRVIVLAAGDGTIRWYRMEDGKEILALFLHSDRTRWIAWIPEGYYMSSPYGDELIGWHLNNGKDRSSDFYAAVQFERILYRPHYVLNYFQHLGKQIKNTRPYESQLFDINKLASIAPPKIKISFPPRGDSGSPDKIRLKIAAQKRSLPMQSYTVFVNNIPVTPSAERHLPDTERDTFMREMEVPFFDDENKVRVEVFNGTSLGFAESVYHGSDKPPQIIKGDLYLLAFGVNDFENMPKNNLAYAALDAEKIADCFKKGAGKVFKRVFVKVISDQSEHLPTKRNIINSFSFIKKSKAQDTVIVFLASHGLSDHDGNYYFVPRDAQANDVKMILETGVRGSIVPNVNPSTLIHWEAFFDALRSVPGKRLLVVDTCQAKNIEGTFDIHSLAKRSVSSSFAIFAASKGSEESQEYPQGKQGLFTYALLEGLSGKGDGNKDGRVSLSELYTFATEFVEVNRNQEIGEQTPQLAAPEALKDIVLAAQ
jgi:WD40 repeat protein